MANLTRRSVLGGSGVVAATFASPLASANADPMARKVAEWRTRWEQDERVVGACSVVCGAPEGSLLVLAGLAVMALAVWGGVALLGSAGVLARRALKNRDIPELPDEDPDDANLYLNVHPRDGWLPTGLRRGALGAAPLRASGRVYGPRGWLANPEGDGVAAGPKAPMPGAPEAALIARVGSDLYFLGEDGTLPAGEYGPVELALNIDPAHGARAKGFFHGVVAL